MATTLTLLDQSLSALKKSSDQTKVQELDVFNGLDTCNVKVTFALSYLKGTGLDWFELSLTSRLNPSWLNDYSNFILELKKNFGLHNPEGEAEANLENSA